MPNSTLYLDLKSMHRLSCAVQQYAWGKVGSNSTVAQLGELNGDISVNEEIPYAEYWFGTHHAGPASVRVAEGNDEAVSIPSCAEP